MHRITFVLILFVLGCGPMGETPGLRLGGIGAAAPESFALLQDIEVIQLEARGRIFPRVVNIWAVGLGDALYVWSDPGSGWSQRVDQRPDDVRVRIGNAVYSLHATRVEEASETKRVAAAFQSKYAESIQEIYGRAMTIEDFELLYRLSPRD